MKKIAIAFGVVILVTIAILNVSKNTQKESMVNEQKTVINMDSSQGKMENINRSQTNNSRYMSYSKTSFEKLPNKKRVYFFHAKWCPTCKAANDEFTQNSDKIPTDVILLKADYDLEKELKSQYGVTYQHTFVYVDSRGKEIKKWNGGGIEELISNTTE